MLLLYALAIGLARGFRRRTLMRVGIAIVTAGIVVFLVRSVLVSQVTNSLVKSEAVKPAAHAVLSIGTSMLSEIAGAFVVVGVPLIAAAWFAGPARLAARGRQAIAPFLREQAQWTYGIVAGDDAPDLHLAADPGHRQTRRDHHVPRPGLPRHLRPAPPDRRRIPRRAAGQRLSAVRCGDGQARDLRAIGRAERAPGRQEGLRRAKPTRGHDLAVTGRDEEGGGPGGA